MRPAGPVYRFNSHSSGPGTCLDPSRTQGAKGLRLALSRASQAPQGTASRQAQAQPAPGHRPGHRGPRAAAHAGRHQVPPKRPVRWARQSTALVRCCVVRSGGVVLIEHCPYALGRLYLDCRAAPRRGKDTTTCKGNKAFDLYRILCL